MFNRIKNILFTPKSEWPVIAGENRPHMTVLTTWVLVLSLIPAIAAFIGYGVLGSGTIATGIWQAIMQYINMVLGVYLSAAVIFLLAGSFGADKNFDQAFSLVAYAYTPAFVGGIFYLIPSLSFLAMICGIYSLVLLYFGLKPMMKVPTEKFVAYFVVSLLAMAAVKWAIGLVLGILIGIFMVAA